VRAAADTLDLVGIGCLWAPVVGVQPFVMQRGKDERQGEVRTTVSPGVSRESREICCLYTTRDDAADASGDGGHCKRPAPRDGSANIQTPSSATSVKAQGARQEALGARQETLVSACGETPGLA
jgi:hypothetical protein